MVRRDRLVDRVGRGAAHRKAGLLRHPRLDRAEPGGGSRADRDLRVGRNQPAARFESLSDRQSGASRAGCKARASIGGLTGVKAGVAESRYRARLALSRLRRPTLPTATATAAVPTTPYERIGGRAAIEAITERFYDLIEEEPAYARLRAMHAEDLGPMRRSLAGFLTGWSGGPRDWWIENPGKCMMSAHKPFAIDRDLAGQWADAMRRAIADAGLEDRTIAAEMADVLERMAQGMINSQGQ